MRLFGLRSTLSLILFGFGVVALPLLLALGAGGLYVDRLSEQARTAVYDAVRAIQGSRSLSESLTAMERTARQFVLLNDPALFDVYRESHEDFQQLVVRLARLNPEPAHRAPITRIGEREQALYERLRTFVVPPVTGAGAEPQAVAPAPTAAVEAGEDIAFGPPSQEEVGAVFVELGNLAGQIRANSSELIDREVDVLQRSAATAQQWLFWMAIALIPLTLISSGLFAVLISRPVRQVNRAIRQLGDGQFDRPIAVRGPDDLRAVGERLDWLRRRLIELEEQKTRFLRHVSHELKTPLTAIRESGDLLREEAVGPLNAAQHEIAFILTDSGRRLQGLIEDLIDFSRTQSQRPSLNLETLSAVDLVETVLQNHKPAIRSKRLEVETDAGTCELAADRSKLHTVIDNLISNAIRFSPEGGRLQVATSQTARTAMIEVADEGPGIPAEERDMIFEAFFQGRTQPKGYVKGSGLGLSIAREYVLAHGGRLDVVDGHGRGARLRLMLPRHAVKARIKQE